MPTYSFRNKQTEEEFDEFMSMSMLDVYLRENPDVEQVLRAVPVADPTRLGLRKPDSNFRDRLKEIKKAHRRSTVNTW